MVFRTKKMFMSPIVLRTLTCARRRNLWNIRKSGGVPYSWQTLARQLCPSP